MNILDEIVVNKRREVSEARGLFPTKLLEKSMFFQTACVSLRAYLNRTDLVGVIAEIKRRSPSKGIINQNISVEQLSIGYMQAGASALSVLTDTKFFGGTSEDLRTARRFNYCPVLRKDFIVEEYQVIEAKSLGADVILLIAAVLTPAEVRVLATLANSLGLEVLLEIHTREEATLHICPEVHLVGVNNRNLNDFSVDVARSVDLAKYIPDEFTKVSESGIASAGVVSQLKELGYRGFLIGESFMRNPKPDEACRRFIESITGLNHAAA